MEAFESFVAVALEAEGLVVSSCVKFPVALQTRKAAYPEIQTHGYEVDLIGAREDRLVLATVKSALGSRGVVAEHVTGETSNDGARKRYALLNNREIRDKVVRQAARQYGYAASQVELRLYVGRFAGRTQGVHETTIRAWARKQRVGGKPIGVFALRDVIDRVLPAAARTEYRDNPVLVTIKVLQEAAMLREGPYEKDTP